MKSTIERLNLKLMVKFECAEEVLEFVGNAH